MKGDRDLWHAVDEYTRDRSDEEEAYFAKLEQGMCPYCESFDTAPIEMQYQAVATRMCHACGHDYVAEW